MNFLDKQVKISENTIVREMGNGFVLLNLNTERFYELNDVGKRFWEILSENKDYNTALQILQEEYEVAPQQLHEDLCRLIENLSKAELIVCQ